ncbi:MAG TPA: hypothetical protein VF771_07785 [Longimicrobiaceae bacterium]
MTSRLCLFVLLALFALFALAACRSQPARFRYLLRDDPTWPADVRRRIDSAAAVNDSIHGCPSHADTLWAGNPRVQIPRNWLEASLRTGCAHAALPWAVRRRLRDDPASLAFYAAVARGAVPAGEDGRARAVLQLSWSADRRYFPLVLAAARAGTPAVTPDSDYNAAYHATVALAPYLGISRQARRVVWRAATHPSSKYARQAGILALAAANDRWSRRALARLPLDSADPYVRQRAARALAHAPCKRGTIFVEWFGVEGQDFSRCEPPPDYR